MRWLAALLVAVLLGSVVGVGIAAVVDIGPAREWLGVEETAGGAVDPDAAPSSQPVEDPKARVAPRPALQRFYDQRPDWIECGDVDCATLEVPLDYARPRGSTIELKLVRRPADEPDQRVGNLVFNPGGPGAPGAWFVAEYGDDLFSGRLLDRVDVIGFDPRGTGESAPVDCLSDAELDEATGQDPDPDTPEEVAELVAAAERFGTGCARLSGDLAAHVSTHEAARDMDVLRAALGDGRLDYHGASYGTRLGATYAELFPKRVGRMVLDGAVDVSLSARDASLQQAAGFETALEAYLDDCLDGDCFLGDSHGEAKRAITDLMASIESEPLVVDDRELRVGNAFFGLIAPLYSRESWGVLDMALKAAIAGDGSTLLYLSDLYSSRNDDGTYADNSSEAIWVINCLDDPAALPADRVPQQFAAFEKASPTFGRIFAWGLTSCAGLAVDPPDFSWDLDAAGAAPILVIGTTRDPATPYRWAKAMARQLDSAILVSRDGDGHTGYLQGSECVDDVVDDYFIEGTVPDGPVDCD